MAVSDEFPLQELVQSEGWRVARRALEQKAEAKARRLQTHRYEDLTEQRADQAELRVLQAFLRSEREVIQFLTPAG